MTIELAGHGLSHIVAALLLISGGAIFVVASIVQGLSAKPPSSNASAVEPPTTARRSLAVMMAAFSAGAAVIHFVAAPGHYDEIGDLAAGFLAAGVFQAVWAVRSLAGPSDRAIRLGIIVNAGIVLAWAYTRTIGLPMDDGRLAPEPVGFPDGASVVFELALVAALLVYRHASGIGIPQRSAARTMLSVAVVPVIGLVLIATSLATVAIASGLEHGLPDGAASTPAHMAHP